jgi:hypothetical protein
MTLEGSEEFKRFSISKSLRHLRICFKKLDALRFQYDHLPASLRHHKHDATTDTAWILNLQPTTVNI